MASPQILIVCTGNVCRSPALEMMLKSGRVGTSWLQLGMQVSSAGTAALAGRPMESIMSDCLGELGVEAEVDFTARQVTPPMVEAAAVIMTMTRDHRAEIFRMAPTALRRTFTVSELVERAPSWAPRGSTPTERISALAEHAARQRGTPMFRRPDEEDIPDPYGRSRRLHRRASARLLAAATELTKALAS